MHVVESDLLCGLDLYVLLNGILCTCFYLIVILTYGSVLLWTSEKSYYHSGRPQVTDLFLLC